MTNDQEQELLDAIRRIDLSLQHLVRYARLVTVQKLELPDAPVPAPPPPKPPHGSR